MVTWSRQRNSPGAIGIPSVGFLYALWIIFIPAPNLYLFIINLIINY